MKTSITMFYFIQCLYNHSLTRYTGCSTRKMNENKNGQMSAKKKQNEIRIRIVYIWFLCILASYTSLSPSHFNSNFLEIEWFTETGETAAFALCTVSLQLQNHKTQVSTVERKLWNRTKQWIRIRQVVQAVAKNSKEKWHMHAVWMPQRKREIQYARCWSNWLRWYRANQQAILQDTDWLMYVVCRMCECVPFRHSHFVLVDVVLIFGGQCNDRVITTIIIMSWERR